MALTEKQKLYIEFYCTTADFTAVEAARQAGYTNPERAGYELMKNSVVIKAIEKRLDTRARSAFYTAEDIQRALWNEVNTREGKGNTQAARVSALVWLGKSIGMWSEVEQKAKLLEKQRENPSVVYNIINYSENKDSTNKDFSKESIEVEVEKNKTDVAKSLKSLENFEVISYNE